MPIQQLLSQIISNDACHARFLNTLSFMENSGARKISASEHPETVSLMILKHAAEEHRHAYYLKKQLEKIAPGSCATYAGEALIAPLESCSYLNKLDLLTSRYLKKEMGLKGPELRFAAYLFVTYAIELRADELYPVYQAELSKSQNKVTVKSIILEEAGHLEEMILQLECFSADWQIHAAVIIDLENNLFTKWIAALEKALND
jgi:rubrerythrin